MKRSMGRYLLVLSIPMVFAVWSSPAKAADISEITADDYYGAIYYQRALEHPQVSRQKSARSRLRMVARDIRWKPKRLAAAIRKVEELSGDPIDLARRAVEGALEASRVQGRVRDVLVNSDEPKHVVMYIRWQGTRGKNAVKEASEIASVVASQAPLVSTLSLACTHPKSPADSKTPVWSAKIGRRAMSRISRSRIDDYADRMYKGLFEIEDDKSQSF